MMIKKTIENLNAGYNFNSYVDKYLMGILQATRWLENLELNELEGDDASGWWLQLYSGRKLPHEISDRMIKKLYKLLPTIELGKSNIYTASALTRTLIRADRTINKSVIIDKFIGLIDTALKNSKSKKSLTDTIWCLQTLYELDALADKSLFEKIKSILDSLEYEELITISMLWQIIKSVLDEDKWKNIVRYIDSKKLEVLSVDWLEKNTDWENSYILLLFIDLDYYHESEIVANYLINKQIDSQWDESLDENIEATSLVGLAFCSYWKYINAKNFVNSQFLIENILKLLIRNKVYQNNIIEEEWIILNKEDGNKGKKFEDFINTFISLDDNLKLDYKNKRTKTEELDFVLTNLEKDLFYKQLQTRQIILECKHTKSKIPAKEIRNFCVKIDNRKDVMCKIGIILSVSGFTKDALDEAKNYNISHDKIIVPITGSDIENAINDSQKFSQLIEKSLEQFLLV